MAQFNLYNYDRIMDAAIAVLECPEEEIREHVARIHNVTFTVVRDHNDQMVSKWYIPGGEVVDHLEWSLQAWIRLADALKEKAA